MNMRGFFKERYNMDDLIDQKLRKILSTVTIDGKPCTSDDVSRLIKYFNWNTAGMQYDDIKIAVNGMDLGTVNFKSYHQVRLALSVNLEKQPIVEYKRKADAYRDIGGYESLVELFEGYLRNERISYKEM